MFYAWRILNGTPGLKREDLMMAVFIQSIQRLGELEWKLVADGVLWKVLFERTCRLGSTHTAEP